MKVEIWSDIMCPFCYIGKRSFDSALAQFQHQDQLEIVWKSFQLDPNLPETPLPDQIAYFEEYKGLSREQMEGMAAHVSNYAKSVGLDFNFEQVQIVNTFKAHRFIQIAKEQGLGNKAEEVLFRAHFVEGKNIGDVTTLQDLAQDIGLNREDVDNALNDDKYAYQTRQEIQEARSVGVRGVPFFVFDRKYAISGAQASDQFLQTLEKTFTEWRAANPSSKFVVNDGDSCAADGSGC